MTSFRNSFALLAVTAALAIGCAGNDHASLATEALAPAGSNAAFVGNTFPTVLAPGERVAISVTVTNTGATPGANDWARPNYHLRVSSVPAGPVYTLLVPATTPVGSNATFNFGLTAPSAPGGYTYNVQMLSTVPGQSGTFGPVLAIPVTVSAGATPQYACSYEPGLSTVPTMLAPDANANVVVAVRNTGTQTWNPGTFYLYSHNSPLNKWGIVNVVLTSAVAPTAVGTFTFTIRAPSTAANHPFVFDMFGSGGLGYFGGDCVNLAINVGGAAAFDSAVVSNTFPATMAPGESQNVSVTFQNTGGDTWTAGTAFAISSTTTPVNQFGTTISYLTTAVPPGSSGTITFSITAPATPGTYNPSYRMRKMAAPSAGHFGATFSTPVVVDAGASPAYGATVAASTFPPRITAGRSAAVAISMQNSGTAAWSGSGFVLKSTSSPAALFGTTALPLGSAETVAPGASRPFNFSITAPATPGSYVTSWRMFGSGIGLFGATASGTVEVTLCGNGTLDAGEQCDDNNLTSGDGCDAFCVDESPPPIALDLSMTNGGRTLLGPSGSALAPVTVGDVTNDGVPDVMVSRVTPPSGVPRATCGVVYGFSGGAGFFTNGADLVPSDAGFAIVGAEAGDQLGSFAGGGLVVGDLTGDGVSDIVVGAPFGDGPANTRVSAGDVYIISGSLALTSAGTIDLGAMTAPSQLAATIYGAVAGDQLVPLAIGDLTGDGFNDLVLGAPQTASGASTAGLVYIVAGSATGLSGTIDLAAPGAITVHTITGAVANDRLGRTAAIGNFMGDGSLDLLLGSSTHTANATRDGSAWAFTGPFGTSRSLGSADAVWIGVANFDGLGASVAVGDVRGTTANDVVIGIQQHQRTPGVQSGAVVVFDGPVAPGIYDLSMSLGAVDALILGPDQFDNFGQQTVLADVTGDGRSDIVASAPNADGPTNGAPNSGEWYVVRGGSSLTGTLDILSGTYAMVVYGVPGPGTLGAYRNTLSVGDVDGDGRADVCGGAHLVGSGAGRIDCVRSPF